MYNKMSVIMNIQNEKTNVFIVRKRNRSNELYMKLINTLLELMTDIQVLNIIQNIK